MVSMVHIIWHRSSNVTWLSLNCCMSTWMTTRMHAKSTMVDPKMHGDNKKQKFL